ncbi:MAG: hypothetical protein IKK93_01190 [Campylobacter sp.]|nr:hypothetical protein [Campylobacter sp.]
MNYNFWKKTGQIKPFNSVEEFKKYCQDIIKDPIASIKANTPLHKSKIKKGVSKGNKFDSFAEFTFCTYMEKIKHYFVERNHKSVFLLYTDEAGKTRKYYPDFIVNGTFYEVKGRLRPKDELKMRQHPEVVFVFQDEINEMAKELDKDYHGWREDFIQTN